MVELLSEVEQFPRHFALRLARRRLELEEHDGQLTTAIAQTNQRRACNLRMLVKNHLDALGVQRFVRRNDAMRLSAAVPEAAVSIEVSHVARAMPNRIAVLRRAE